MNRRRLVAAVSLLMAGTLGLAACGGSDDSSGGSGGDSEFNAAVSTVFNPSETAGGTLRYANSGDWDSLDPADTYYAYSWNFARLYGRSLMMFAPKPGADGAKLVPDLAEAPGVSSDEAKTWTYKIRKGVKFEDGTEVTSKDVKYAVERSTDKQTFPQGPFYFNDFLDLGDYAGPYKDKGKDLKAIETPDDQTIVFHLKKPFAAFDYFAQQPATMPVQESKDTGSKYKEHVVSTGPYMFKTNNLGKNFTMVRNPNWDQATDPNRKPLPDQIEVQLNVNADDMDNRLLSGDLDVAIEGSGVQPSAQGRILTDNDLKSRSDSAITTRLWFTSLSGLVKPLDNIHCRKAVLWATDKVGYQNAYGGPIGGDIATNLLPPVIPGSEKFNLYPSADNKGDLAKAKQELTECGQASGFDTSISYRAERPKEKAVAESLQQSLKRVGINLTIKPYPLADYVKLYAGKPDFMKKENLGLMVYGWSADWPDGYGFLSQIVDSRVIKPQGGNTNLGVTDPEVDKLVDKALVTTDLAANQKVWVDVDKKVMDDAYDLPGIWSKGLLFRPENLTNVFVTDGFSMYDYLALGTTRK